MLTTEFVSFQNNPNNGDIMRFLSHIDVSKRVSHASDRDLVDLLYFTVFGWSTLLQRYSIFLSHHSSHQLQLQPAQQYFSLTPFQLQPPAPACRTQWLFSSDETLDLHLIICGDAAAPTYMYINYLYCTTLCDSSFHMMFISFSSCSMLKPHVTFCKKIPIVTYIIAYQEQILLPNSY